MLRVSFHAPEFAFQGTNEHLQSRTSSSMTPERRTSVVSSPTFSKCFSRVFLAWDSWMVFGNDFYMFERLHVVSSLHTSRCQ